MDGLAIVTQCRTFQRIDQDSGDRIDRWLTKFLAQSMRPLIAPSEGARGDHRVVDCAR